MELRQSQVEHLLAVEWPFAAAPATSWPARWGTVARRAERFALLKAMEEDYPIVDLCAAFSVLRAGFYAWRERQPSTREQADEVLGGQIGTPFARSRRTYGSPRLYRVL